MIYNVIVRCSVFTVFQKKKTPQGDGDLYSLPTKQGECQKTWVSLDEGLAISVTLEALKSSHQTNLKKRHNWMELQKHSIAFYVITYYSYESPINPDIFISVWTWSPPVTITRLMLSDFFCHEAILSWYGINMNWCPHHFLEWALETEEGNDCTKADVVHALRQCLLAIFN